MRGTGNEFRSSVVVVKELETEIYYGGAAIVALHINVGGNVILSVLQVRIIFLKNWKNF